MKAAGLVMVALALAGCGGTGFFGQAERPVAAVTVDDGEMRPQSRPDALDTAPTPPPSARTVEEFDTTTVAERKEAAAAPEPAGERKLGETVASLGDVAKPGFWLETPLVKEPAKGRIFYPATGKSAQVELIPIPGAVTAGSRISLAAMRLIEAQLTDLPTIEVYVGG